MVVLIRFFLAMVYVCFPLVSCSMVESWWPLWLYVVTVPLLIKLFMGEDR